MAKTLEFTIKSPRQIKQGDTETTFTFICKNDGSVVDLTKATSITAKIGNASGYLRSQSIATTSLAGLNPGWFNLQPTPTLISGLPAGDYQLEIWVIDQAGTSIYPSDTPLSFTITNNIQSANGSVITTITFDDFVKAMNKAASTIAKGDKGEKGDPGDNGFYHYSVDLTDTKYDRNKWYYVESDGHQPGSLGGTSYFGLEAPLYSGINVPYGNHDTGSSKDASARQAVIYGQSGWGAYNRKLNVIDDQTSLTIDGKRLLTFAAPGDNNLNYAFYARGGLKINITSDVPGLTWTPHTDTFVENETTISVLNDEPDPKVLGLDDNHAFWSLPMSQLKQQLKDAIPKGDTSARPTGIITGYQYFDTSLNKPIWYTGTNWVDAMGATV